MTRPPKQQIPLHPCEQARRGPRFGNDRKKGNDENKDKGGSRMSFELSVFSFE
jgi:hypothetical protein